MIIEKNVALGDLVDTSTDLFKIADLSRLRVMAHAYEEDLPALDTLKDSRRSWSVVVGAGSEDAVTRDGRFDQIGSIIDPNQHTALVMGWVDNPDGRLRVGQFVTVRVEIAAAEDGSGRSRLGVGRRRRASLGPGPARRQRAIRCAGRWPSAAARAAKCFSAGIFPPPKKPAAWRRCSRASGSSRREWCSLRRACRH